MYVVSSKQMYKNVFDWAVSSSYQKGNTMHSYEHVLQLCLNKYLVDTTT